MFKLGMIGTGIISGAYFQALNECLDFKLVAICEINEEKARKISEEQGIPYYLNYKEMCDKEEIDAVIINLPHFLHCEVSVYCLEKGIHVLCEKPMANTVEECERMIEASKVGKAKLAIGHIMRFFPGMRVVKEYVESEKLGKLTMINEVRNEPYFLPSRPKWFFSKKHAGGGIVMNFGAHALDKLAYVLGGNFENISAVCGNFCSDDDVEGHAQIYLTANGVPVSITFSGYAPYNSNDAIYADNQKKKYVSDNHKPIMYNGKLYVSDEFIEDILLIDCPSSEKENVNGKMMLPASVLGDLKSLEYSEDERGFFTLSTEEFQHKNSDNFIELFEMSDLIYREIMFGNPDGEEIFSDLSAESQGVHPRILYSVDDINYIKNKISNDVIWQNALQRAVTLANNALNYDNRFTADCPDSEKQLQATDFQSAIEALATAYIFTDETTYADKAIEYMKKLCNWETIGYEKSNLTIGHWAMGMAIGYDTFYNYMSLTQSGKEDLNFIKDAANRLIFADTINAYNGKTGPHWIGIRDNFQGVISGGVMCLLLSMADDEVENPEYTYLFENVMKSMEIAVSLFGKNGGYFEGINYSRYCLENLTTAISALLIVAKAIMVLAMPWALQKQGAFSNICKPRSISLISAIVLPVLPILICPHFLPVIMENAEQWSSLWCKTKSEIRSMV